MTPEDIAPEFRSAPKSYGRGEPIPGVKTLRLSRHTDDRGFFLEIFRARGEGASAALASFFDGAAPAQLNFSTVDAAGHTPGHTVFALQSGNDALMVLSDTTQHPALFARHPDWQPQFDIDGALAVATRRKLLDRAATDRMLVTGYHFPFPACGHIVKTATGYEHVPVLWNISV